MIGHAQGNSWSNAIPITIPTFETNWISERKSGEQYLVPLKKTGDVVWYKFELEDDFRVLLHQLGSEQNYASVELLDKSLKTIAKSDSKKRTAHLVSKEDLTKGDYFIKVTSIANNGYAFKIEACRLTKKQVEDSNRYMVTSLVGRWRHVDGARGLATNLTFKEDGTYSGSVEVDGKTNVSFSGKWSVTTGKLRYEYTASSNPIIPVGTVDEDDIVEMGKDHYTIVNTLGIRERYTRMK